MRRAVAITRQLSTVSPLWYLLLGAAIAFVGAPQLNTRNVITEIFIMIILVSGLNYIAGYGRLPSLAQAGFFGIGAYASAIADVHGVPSVIAFLLGPLFAGLAAVIVGAVSLHLRGMYFIMATLGAGLVVDLVASGAVGLTGGPNGLLGIGTLHIGSLELSSPEAMYILAGALAALCVGAAWRFERSKIGLALRAMGASEPAAVGCGVSPFHIRLTAFVISGIYAGIAGSIETYFTGFVSPSSFTFFEAVLLLVGVTLGGAGRVWGAVLGALILVGLQQVLQGYPDYESLALGVAFILIIQRFPEGVAGGVLAAARFGATRWARAS